MASWTLRSRLRCTLKSTERRKPASVTDFTHLKLGLKLLDKALVFFGFHRARASERKSDSVLGSVTA